MVQTRCVHVGTATTMLDAIDGREIRPALHLHITSIFPPRRCVHRGDLVSATHGHGSLELALEESEESCTVGNLL